MKTALYDKHVQLGAKMVEFAGWEMPVFYQGIIPEHNAVRNHAGIFDVSHMGRILIYGEQAEAFLDYISTNSILGKPDLSATYTVLPNENGGSVDDVIIYKQDPQHFFMIANASNRSKDLQHVKKYAVNFGVNVEDCFQNEGILAVQGPQAIEIGSRIFPELQSLKNMRFISTRYNDKPIILSGTGYTGAGGFEIFAPIESIAMLWEAFLQEGVQPVGLGARDTLRLEAGFALYGHELSDTIAPSESVSAWTMKWKKDFISKPLLQQLENDPNKRMEKGIILLDKGIAREGNEVYKEEKPIGKVTSGTFSPTLNKSIAIVLVDGNVKEGDILEIQIRQNKVKAEVISLPFLKKSGI